MKWVIPSSDAVTLGEVDGELVHSNPYKRLQRLPNNLPLIPQAKIATNTAFRPHKRSNSSAQKFQTRDLDDKADRFTVTGQSLQWLEILLWRDTEVAISSLNKLYDRCIEHLSNLISAIPRRFQPQSDKSFLQTPTHKFIPVQTNETIHSIHWHSHELRLAVAQCDGVVSFYDVISGVWDKRVLTHENHTIFCIAWCSVPDGTIAVACSGGIYLWKVSSIRLQESPQLLNVFSHPIETKYDSLSWDADGSMLAAILKGFKEIHIYDVITLRRTELHCSDNPTAVYWSPRGDYLFCTTSKSVLFWETCSWTHEIWDIEGTSGVWASNGESLIIADQNHLIYRYIFHGTAPAIEAELVASPIDFREQIVRKRDPVVEIIGGDIIKMVWDPSGQRVAVLYDSTADGTHDRSKLVAIFQVGWKPFMTFTESGLIRGPLGSGVPLDLGYAADYEHGALLSVAWSSGIITFYPFLFL